MTQPAGDYLFLCTIGPVQEFIASARRSRDLWYGSWMLSELSRAAAEAIRQEGGAVQLIFPHELAVQARSGLANIANKILAKVTIDPTALGNVVTKAVNERLIELRDDAFNRTPDWQLGDLDLAKQQVEALLECYWAAVPFPDQKNYSKQRALLEQVMSARKATRQFGRVLLTTEQERYPKSSLDGQRESVIREHAYPARGDNLPDRRRKLQRLFTTFGAKQAERLSGVDLLKRQGNYQEDQSDFPSTSHFAAVPFIEQLVEKHGADKVRNVFTEYRSQLEALVTEQRLVRLERLSERHRLAFAAIENYDASILYRSRLAEEIDVRDEQARTSAEQSLQQFIAIAANGAEPRAYYALLQADGDNMGAVIDSQQTVADHQELSKQLAMFADAARTIVEANKGALVYAGGDDVLALLPVDSVLQCAQALHGRFDELIGRHLLEKNSDQPRFRASSGRPATLSVGIAICHHLEPLNDALALVRNTEKAAKKVKDAGGHIIKNGLAIAVEKRSGEPQRIAGSWADADGFFTRLQSWLRLMQDDELSAGAPYELRDLTERLAEPQELTVLNQPQHRAVAEEAGRIVERKRGRRGKQNVVEAEIAHLREWLGLPEKNKDSIIIPASAERYREQKLTVRQLSDELIVARELVRLGAQPIEIEI